MDAVFGPYHKDGNHWTLVYIDFKKKQLLYIDPLGPPNEHELAETFAYHWLEWSLLHNSICTEAVVPTELEAVTVQHALQRDSRNCGIFTMCVRNTLLLCGRDEVSNYVKSDIFCSHFS